jgi:hypothetical protein
MSLGFYAEINRSPGPLSYLRANMPSSRCARLSDEVMLIMLIMLIMLMGWARVWGL